MKQEYRQLRVKQLASALDAFATAKNVARPSRGWLRAVREAMGLTQQRVANAMKVKQQAIDKFESAEANDRITLRNLRRVADAMGCELVYALVPKHGTITELAEQRARDEATKRVRAVEHTMALEDQAVGNTKSLIEEETKRGKKKS